MENFMDKAIRELPSSELLKETKDVLSCKHLNGYKIIFREESGGAGMPNRYITYVDCDECGGRFIPRPSTEEEAMHQKNWDCSFIV
jgi:hypothetical protein